MQHSSQALSLSAAPQADTAAATAAASGLVQASHAQLAAVQGLQLRSQDALAVAAVAGLAGASASSAGVAPWAVLGAASLERTGLNLTALDSSSLQPIAAAADALSFSVMPAVDSGISSSAHTADPLIQQQHQQSLS